MRMKRVWRVRRAMRVWGYGYRACEGPWPLEVIRVHKVHVMAGSVKSLKNYL